MKTISEPLTLKGKTKAEALQAIKRAAKVSLWFVFGGSGGYVRLGKRKAEYIVKNATEGTVFEVIRNCLGNVYIAEGETA